MEQKIPKGKKRITLDIETTGLLPWYGDRVTCICAASEEGSRFGMADRNEEAILSAFDDWMAMKPPIEHYLVTKNGKIFDIPFLLARSGFCMRPGSSTDSLSLIPQPSANWLLEYDHFDLHQAPGGRTKLEDIAKLLGCSPKSGTGANAIKLFERGQLEELLAYCNQDVDTTDQVFLVYAALHGLTEEKE